MPEVFAERVSHLARMLLLSQKKKKKKKLKMKMLAFHAQHQSDERDHQRNP
jgi:hypothetical protein